MLSADERNLLLLLARTVLGSGPASQHGSNEKRILAAIAQVEDDGCPIIGSVITLAEGIPLEPDASFRQRIIFVMPHAPMSTHPVMIATGKDLDRIGRKYGQIRQGLEAKPQRKEV